MNIDSPLHIRLLNMLSAIRDLSPFDSMTADEDELLRDLIVRWHGAEDIAVGDVMRDSASVSQSTAYRRLIALRDKGLVYLRTDESDRRVKFVEPTNLAQEYTQHIHKALEKTVGKVKPA